VTTKSRYGPSRRRLGGAVTKAGNRLVAPRRPPQSRRTREACRREGDVTTHGDAVARAARYFEQEKPRCGCRHGDGADRSDARSGDEKDVPGSRASLPSRCRAATTWERWSAPSVARAGVVTEPISKRDNEWRAQFVASIPTHVGVEKHQCDEHCWLVGSSRRDQSPTAVKYVDGYLRPLRQDFELCSEPLKATQTMKQQRPGRPGSRFSRRVSIRWKRDSLAEREGFSGSLLGRAGESDVVLDGGGGTD
jgi:hypothetical protein